MQQECATCERKREVVRKAKRHQPSDETKLLVAKLYCLNFSKEILVDVYQRLNFSDKILAILNIQLSVWEGYNVFRPAFWVLCAPKSWSKYKTEWG